MTLENKAMVYAKKAEKDLWSLFGPFDEMLWVTVCVTTTGCARRAWDLVGGSRNSNLCLEPENDSISV
jgi:hypothetical protein